MTTSPEHTIVDPSKAPHGRRPQLLGIEYLRLTYVHEQYYRCEGWHLTDGAAAVIVTDNGGTSLMNASEKVSEMVRERWPHPNLTIIEDWIQPFINGDPTTRFRISNEKGSNSDVKYDNWDPRGLVLPR
ncbi:hypothetical protein NKG05_30620 [Oerskovia sp. M15]